MKRTFRIPARLLGCAITIVFLCPTGWSTVVSVGGASVLVASPANATLNQYTHASQIRVWDELQGVTLSSGVIADAAAPGTYDQPTDLVVVNLAAGTMVDSHFIHFDLPSGTTNSANGSVTFAGRIIGVMALGDGGSFFRLDDSDFLSSGTLYDNGLADRGLEMISSGQSDRFTISPDGKSIQVHFEASEPGDRIRVLTEANVPEPGTMAAVGAALAAYRIRRRTRPS